MVFNCKLWSPGVLYSDGAIWEEQRQFTSGLLHDFAFSSENLIQEEIDEFIKEIHSSSTSDGTVNLKGVFTTSVINILWGIIGGQRLKRNDPNFKQLSETVEVMFQTAQSPGIMVHLHHLIFRYLPILKSFFGYKQELLQPMTKLIEVSFFFYSIVNLWIQLVYYMLKFRNNLDCFCACILFYWM